MKEGTMAAASGAFFTWHTACHEHAHATITEIPTSAQKREKLQFSSAWPMTKMLACTKEGREEPSVRARKELRGRIGGVQVCPWGHGEPKRGI
jgi:hypothetical protein